MCLSATQTDGTKQMTATFQMTYRLDARREQMLRELTSDMAALVEGTDYFVHYESGNDSIVTISDQSTKSGFGLVVHK
mgnify:CR=1 FL=1